MVIVDVIDDAQSYALAWEAARAVMLGFLAGLLVFAPLAAMLCIDVGVATAFWYSALAAGFALTLSVYGGNFGFFTTAKVTARLQQSGVNSSPDLTFGRLDALLRRMWLFGWIFGLLESALLLSLAVTR